MPDLQKFEIVIPIYNGGAVFRDCLASIQTQTLQPERILVVDSASTDGSAELARAAGCEVKTIAKEDFDHGGTRNFATQFVETPFVVLMTQDAILESHDSVQKLMDALAQDRVAAVYGRQLPHDDADPLAIFARSKTYSSQSYVCDAEDAHPVGFAKCFMSNSFAAYDVNALNAVGGFPEKLVLGEDSFVAARLLSDGYRVAYAADARVKHSHNYTAMQEFRRYFDIGVFHETQSWMLDRFGSPLSRGKEFALSQIRWLRDNGHSRLIPQSILASAAKLIGYKLGKRHKTLGPALSRKLAMHKAYFARPAHR